VRTLVPEEIHRPAAIYPPVIGLVARMNARHGSRDVFVPWDKVRVMSTDGVYLSSPALNLERFARRDGELTLREGLLDRQVVDVEGRRVVRINDLELRETAGAWRLVAVDVSVAGLLRRAGGSWLEKRLVNLLGRDASTPPLIDWAAVVPVADSGPSEGGALQLRVPRDRLSLLDPADLARVVEQLTPQQGAELLSGFDDARAADTLEELEDEQQAQVLRAMDRERAADVLEEMEPDEAVDALQSFEPEEAQDLLKRMEPEEAAEVQELMRYSENSVGGLMTNEYISVPAWATAGGVISALRVRARQAANDEADPLPAALPEIYVVAEDGEDAFEPRPPGAPVPLDAEGRLVGTLTLRDLLLAYPETRIADIMQTDLEVASPDDAAREAARVIAEHDLVALPVVDEGGRMLGIVTVDDAIDVILPKEWKKHLPRTFR
jgi:magnesium transporter